MPDEEFSLFKISFSTTWRLTGETAAEVEASQLSRSLHLTLYCQSMLRQEGEDMHRGFFIFYIFTQINCHTLIQLLHSNEAESRLSLTPVLNN